MTKASFESPPSSIATLLRLPYRALVRELYSRLAAEGFDLQPAHSSVFPYLREGPSHSKELAEKAQVTKQSMGYLLDSLENGGYVERTRDAKDGRAKLVRLTPRGEEAERAAARLMAEIEAEWSRRLGRPEFDRLRAELQRLEELLREESASRE